MQDLKKPEKIISPQTPRCGYTEEERRTRDQYLLACRAEGMSYKEIKMAGNLPEAESTLRGRYRVLTKGVQVRSKRPKRLEREESRRSSTPSKV